MEYDFKKSKYFKYLSENLQLLERDRVEFNNKILPLLKNKTDELGLVLKCHLIIEHYIDEYLRVAYPTIIHWDNMRLNFNQKLELIYNSHTIFIMTYSSIKCLNSLRNKFSHKIAYKIKKEDFKEIEEYVTMWYKAAGYPIPSGHELFEQYTLLICSDFNTMIRGIKKQSQELGLSGYLEWLVKMTKNE